MRRLRFLAAFALASWLGPVADAASLRVAPVLIDLSAPQQASTLKVWNDGDAPIHVQVRIFRWRQENGQDVLEPTRDVVVSPPMAALAPKAENVIRVVRVAKTPVTAEESYRVLVDEIPDPARRQGGAVALVLRHSIPVFFAAPTSPAAKVTWAATPADGGYWLTAFNTGARRLRVTNLAVDAGGKPLGRKDGLVGYVLGGASARWFVATEAKTPPASLTISADSETGHVRAVARPSGG